MNTVNAVNTVNTMNTKNTISTVDTINTIITMNIMNTMNIKNTIIYEFTRSTNKANINSSESLTVHKYTKYKSMHLCKYTSIQKKYTNTPV